MLLEGQEETTCVLIKPDVVKRGVKLFCTINHELTGGTVRLWELSCSVIRATRGQIEAHYDKDDDWIIKTGKEVLEIYEKYGRNVKAELGTSDPYNLGKIVLGWMTDFMTSGDLVALVIQGDGAIQEVRKKAGRIREEYMEDSLEQAVLEHRALENLIHASENPEEARKELAIWFPDRTFS